MKYSPLLEFKITHPFYTDRNCPDFVIEPTAATQQLLTNHRCVLKILRGGIRILRAVTKKDVPLIPITKALALAFHLRLRNPAFVLFTNMIELSQTPAPLYTHHINMSSTLVQLILTSRKERSTEQLHITQPATSEQFVLGGIPKPGLQRDDFSITGLGEITSPSHVDLATRIITVNTSSAAKDTVFSIAYESIPKLTQGVFADVDIYYQDPDQTPIGTVPKFEIAFQAKASRWQYYIIANTNNAKFRIEDGGKAPVTFSDENIVNLTTHPDKEDDMATRLARRFPDMECWRLVSDAPVACSQEPHSSIQLLQNRTIIIHQLPNPSLENFVLMTGKDNGTPRTESALFHLIKLFHD